MIRNPSVRNPDEGADFAVLSCRAFAAPAATGRQSWRIPISQNGVQALCVHPCRGLEFLPDDPRMVDMIWQRGGRS
ncbi:MAG: hypothetical protein EA339_11175 [Rhodobacteraceae bacterium]|nr:MAG: hypothetical protein EA339_11175 [Paracoccaceae bacterium]